MLKSVFLLGFYYTEWLCCYITICVQQRRKTQTDLRPNLEPLSKASTKEMSKTITHTFLMRLLQ